MTLAPKRAFVATSLLRNALRVLSRPRYARAVAAAGLEARRLQRAYPKNAEGRAGAIRMVSLQLTELCNLRCHTCGQWGDHGYLLERSPAQLKANLVPASRYQQVLEDLKAHGHAPMLHLWGGEPMLYPGVLDVVETGARLGMPPAMNTNGVRVARHAERLVAAPLFAAILSVDGPDAEVHNAARPGAHAGHDNFAEVLAALEALREARGRGALPLLMTNTVVSRRNAGRLVEIYERFRPLTDLMSFNLGYWIDAPRAEAQRADFARRFGEEARSHTGWLGDWHDFDHRALSAELTEIERRSLRPGGVPVSLSPPLVAPDDLETYYRDHAETFGHDRCASIFQIPEVDSAGNVYPCRDYHDYVVGNLRDHTLTELWNSERFVAFRRSIVEEGLMPVCTRCCGLMGYQA